MRFLRLSYTLIGDVANQIANYLQDQEIFQPVNSLTDTPHYHRFHPELGRYPCGMVFPAVLALYCPVLLSKERGFTRLSLARSLARAYNPELDKGTPFLPDVGLLYRWTTQPRLSNLWGLGGRPVPEAAMAAVLANLSVLENCPGLKIDFVLRHRVLQNTRDRKTVTKKPANSSLVKAKIQRKDVSSGSPVKPQEQRQQYLCAGLRSHDSEEIKAAATRIRISPRLQYHNAVWYVQEYRLILLFVIFLLLFLGTSCHAHTHIHTGPHTLVFLFLFVLSLSLVSSPSNNNTCCTCRVHTYLEYLSLYRVCFLTCDRPGGERRTQNLQEAVVSAGHCAFI